MGVAAVYRIDEKYLPNVEILLSSVSCCAFVASCLLLHFDQLDGCVLNPPTPQTLTNAQAVARSFEESDHLLDFHDHDSNVKSDKSGRKRNHRD